MCEMLGTEPIEEEIPVDFFDLPEEVQSALLLYDKLQDSWDYMSGRYLGKQYSGISDILDISEVDDKKTCFTVIQYIDRLRISILNEKNPAK